jgi:hypothetical protein
MRILKIITIALILAFNIGARAGASQSPFIEQMTPSYAPPLTASATGSCHAPFSCGLGLATATLTAFGKQGTTTGGVDAEPKRTTAISPGLSTGSIVLMVIFIGVAARDNKRRPLLSALAFCTSLHATPIVSVFSTGYVVPESISLAPASFGLPPGTLVVADAGDLSASDPQSTLYAVPAGGGTPTPIGGSFSNNGGPFGGTLRRLRLAR